MGKIPEQVVEWSNFWCFAEIGIITKGLDRTIDRISGTSIELVVSGEPKTTLETLKKRIKAIPNKYRLRDSDIREEEIDNKYLFETISTTPIMPDKIYLKLTKLEKSIKVMQKI